MFDNTVSIIFLAALHKEKNEHFENTWLRCAVVELGAMGKENLWSSHFEDLAIGML